MKRTICLIAVIVMAGVLLTACGSGNKRTNNNTEAPAYMTEKEGGKSSEASEDRFTFTFRGTDIVLKAEAAPILEALGEPKHYTEEESCAFGGLDKNYTYTSFILTTYPDGETDRINSVTLVDDTVSTNCGICIGDPGDKVEEVYGAETYNGVNAYIMKTDDSQLAIIMGSDKVSSIQYAARFD